MGDPRFDSDFGLGLRPKRGLCSEISMFCATVFGLWGLTHVTLNYSAFAEIAEFEVGQLQASVLEATRSMPSVSATVDVVDEDEEFEEEREVVVEENLKSVRRKNRFFSKKRLKPKTQIRRVFEKTPIYPSDNRIVIPRIGKNVPLVDVPDHKNWSQLENNIQSGLQNGVVVHPVSHAPGTLGNFFITGHSSYYQWDEGRFKDVFALLHEVRAGDLVEVYWGGQKFDYIMREKKVVPPTEVSVLNQPSDSSIMTLMTCTPIGTNKNRLILVGELKR